MKEKLQFVRLPILLFVIFFLGRLALGAAMGVSKPTYDLAKRLFSMVILEVHVGLLWGAVGRRYRGYGIGGSMTAVVLAVVVSQILIFARTAISYIAGINTLFNFGEALNQPGATLSWSRDGFTDAHIRCKLHHRRHCWRDRLGLRKSRSRRDCQEFLRPVLAERVRSTRRVVATRFAVAQTDVGGGRQARGSRPNFEATRRAEYIRLASVLAHHLDHHGVLESHEV